MESLSALFEIMGIMFAVIMTMGFMLMLPAFVRSVLNGFKRSAAWL